MNDLETVKPLHPTARHVDRLVKELAQCPQAATPVVHRFTPGLYVREIFMPKGTLIVSKIHKTEHPYVVSQGRAAVWTEEGGIVHIQAPFCGITKPGTRRILYIHEDCVWTTFHPTPETDVDKIETAIIDKQEDVIEVDGTLVKQLAEAMEGKES